MSLSSASRSTTSFTDGLLLGRRIGDGALGGATGIGMAFLGRDGSLFLGFFRFLLQLLLSAFGFSFRRALRRLFLEALAPGADGRSRHRARGSVSVLTSSCGSEDLRPACEPIFTFYAGGEIVELAC